MRKILNIKNNAERSEILIYDEIGEGGWWSDSVSAKDIMEELKECDGKPLDVRINSPGGSVFDGIAIYNALKRYSGEVTIYIDGLAASIASVIACASNDVRIGNGASVMIHNPMTFAFQIGDAEDIEKETGKTLSALKNAKNSILDIYVAKTGMDRDELSSLMDEETWLTSNEAIEKGFCNQLVDDRQDEALENSLTHLIYNSTHYKPNISHIYNSIFNQQGGKKMPKPNQNQAVPNIDPQAQDAATIRAQALAEFQQKEEARREEIGNLFAKFPHLSDLRNEMLLDSNITADYAKDRLLEAVADGEHVKVIDKKDPLANKGIHIGDDLQEEGIKKALENRAQNKFDRSNEHSNISPTGLLRAIAAKNGHVNIISKNNVALVDELIGNPQVMDDFEVYMGEFVHRAGMYGYESVATTYQRFVRNRALEDFRPHEIYAHGTSGNLKKKGDDGNYQVITLPDAEKQAYSGDEWGRIIQIDRKVLINDDWGIIQDQSEDGGRSTARTIEFVVYDLLKSNPVLADGKPLFDESRGNVLGFKEMSEEAWEALLLHFEGLTAPNSPQDYLHILHKYLLTDAKGRIKARELNTKETGKEAKSTIGFFEDENIINSPHMRNVPEIYLSDTPLVELGWVGGAIGPNLLVKEHFNSGAYRARVNADFGVGLAGWRGAAIRELIESGEEPETKTASKPAVKTDKK